MNLIPKTKPNLCSSTWHPTIVKFNQSSEVEENTLGCLWSQEAFQLPSWSNISAEHKVEGDGLGEVVSCIWSFQLIFLDACVDLLLIVFLAVTDNLVELFSFFGFHVFLLCDHLGDCLLDELVSSMTLSIFSIFHHKVCKFIDVT